MGGLSTGSFRAFIYVNNAWRRGRNPIRNTEITQNVCRSLDAANFFTHGVLVYGGAGGFEDVRVFDNDCELYIVTSKPIGGGLGVAGGNEAGMVEGVQLGGNTVKNLQPPEGPTQACLQIGPFVENLRSVRANTGIGGFYGLRVIGETGRRMENIRDQVFRKCRIPLHIS